MPSETASSPVCPARHVAVGPEDGGRRLDNFLLARVEAPRKAVYRWIRTGQVRVNRGRAPPSRRLQVGDEVRIPPFRPDGPRGLSRVPPDIPLPVLYEDGDLLILNKPSGLAVHGGSRLGFGLLDVLRAHAHGDGFLELAHRLDRGSSGCLVLARNRDALRHVQAQWRTREAVKIYWVLMAGRWRGGVQDVRQPLQVNRRHAKHRKTVADTQGREAHTRFRPLEQFERACLLEARIATGRTHQIRVHASGLGHPVVGDDRYGDRKVNRWAEQRGFRRLFLHARALELAHPSRPTSIKVAAPLDRACERLLAELRDERPDSDTQ